jgi:hypothetical protein
MTIIDILGSGHPKRTSGTGDDQTKVMVQIGTSLPTKGEYSEGEVTVLPENPEISLGVGV